MATPEDLANRFSFHPASTQEKRDAHEFIRDECLSLANALNSHVPDGREKALVMTKLEEVMFWANAAIARSA